MDDMERTPRARASVDRSGLESLLDDVNELRDRLEGCHDKECRVCKENAARIERVKAALYTLAFAVREAHGANAKIFTYLNSYAKKEDLAQWSATSPFAVLGQVYGDLAAGFDKIKKADEVVR